MIFVSLQMTHPYVCDSNLKSVLEKLEHNSELAIAWFEMNYMKLNTDKCRPYIWAKLDQDIVWRSNDVKLLGVTIDNNLFSPFTYTITYKVRFWSFKSLCKKNTVSNKTYQYFRDKTLVRPGSKYPNRQRSQPISYKSKL